MATKRKPAGRPSSFTPKIANEICARLAEGQSLRRISADPKMPDRATVFRWLFQGKEVEEGVLFRDQYARAREFQAETMAEEIVDIADDGSNDTYLDKDGKEVVNNDVIQRSRLRVDARKWAATKLLPKQYGERQTVEHDGVTTINVVTGIDAAPASRRK